MNNKITLEPIYLANILLYLPTFETIKKFIQISKNCLESSKIIRFYSQKFNEEKEIEIQKQTKLFQNELNEEKNSLQLNSDDSDVINNFFNQNESEEENKDNGSISMIILSLIFVILFLI